ncbi:hypothetical protein FSP39_000053 [Pinctada imbricata]|uniref:Uncharacterized protein n=1 Tax=Pinctada imbricata TaxID=66713 RepID=A0AA89BUE6_PINIB|nr:hypothetical protein FSP39_000053 [Pinctada imbricata]
MLIQHEMILQEMSSLLEMIIIKGKKNGLMRDKHADFAIQFEEEIIHHDITGQPDRWSLYCGSETGNLYKVEEESNGHKDSDRELYGNHEIFTDLLSDDGTAKSKSSIPIHYVTKSSAIYTFSERILSISCYGSILAVCLSKPTAYVTQVYSVNESKHLSVLTSFYVPKSKDIDSKRTPSLVYFCTCPLIEETCDVIPSSTLNLNAPLYTGIFGRSSVLLKSDIILFCPPEGDVFYAPLKSLDCNNRRFDWTEFKLLHHTSQPVTSVCSIKLKEKRDKKKNVFDVDTDDYDFSLKDSVVIASADGKCSVILEEESDLHFVDVVLPGPVVDLSICGTSIFVSTGRDMYRLELEVTYQNGSPVINIVKRDSLHLTNVSHLLCLPDHSEVEDRKCQLLCNFRSGKVKIINPIDRLNISEFADGKNSGTKIKELLQCIDSCQRESNKLNMLRSEQTIFLRQLHLAAYLLSTDNQKSSLFQCKTPTTTPLSGLLSDVCICCHITNTSKLSLSIDWSVLVHISQHNCTNKSVSKSVKLAKDFGDGETISISTNLPSLEIKIPYQVEITLLLHLPSIIEGKGLHGTCGKQTLPVIIHTESIDILYFLHHAEKFHRMIHWPDIKPDDVIQQLAMKQPIARTLMENTVVQSRVQEESCSFDLYFVTNNKLKEQEILTQLFQNSFLSEDVIPNPVSLLSLAGHRASIGMSRSADKGQGQEVWKLTVQLDMTSLAAALRLGIVRRLQNLHFNRVHLNPTKDSRPVPDPRNSLKDLHKKMNEVNCDATVDSSQKLQTVYKQLRQT